MVELTSVLLMMIGVGLGLVIGWYVAKGNFSGKLIRSEEQMKARQEAMAAREIAMKSEIEILARDVVRKNSEDFLQIAEERLGKVQVSAEKDHIARTKAMDDLIKPMENTLGELQKVTTEMEKSRVGAYKGLEEQVKGLRTQTQELRDTNITLSTALRGSIKARGNWGQISLKNIAESAGMLEHCDFDVEYTLESGKGGSRVDMIARIPGGGDIPVDAKVPLASYWDALDIVEPEGRQAKMVDHAKEVKKHIEDLSKREYSNKMQGADFTVMYIPAEPILSAAFEINPELQDFAFRRKVLIATPVTLIALLKTVAIYWQQVSLAENAKEIHEAANEFYGRAKTFGSHLAKMGRGLNQAVTGFNDAVGSYDSRIIPSGEKLKQLKVIDSATELDKPLEIGTNVRTSTKAPSTDEEE